MYIGLRLMLQIKVLIPYSCLVFYIPRARCRYHLGTFHVPSRYSATRIPYGYRFVVFTYTYLFLRKQEYRDPLPLLPISIRLGIQSYAIRITLPLDHQARYILRLTRTRRQQVPTTYLFSIADYSISFDYNFFLFSARQHRFRRQYFSRIWT